MGSNKICHSIIQTEARMPNNENVPFECRVPKNSKER